MPRNRTASIRKGSTIGTVIVQNVATDWPGRIQPPLDRSGIDRRPARQINITNGVHIQVSTMMIDQGARETSPIIEKLVELTGEKGDHVIEEADLRLIRISKSSRQRRRTASWSTMMVVQKLFPLNF